MKINLSIELNPEEVVKVASAISQNVSKCGIYERELARTFLYALYGVDNIEQSNNGTNIHIEEGTISVNAETMFTEEQWALLPMVTKMVMGKDPASIMN